MSIGFFVVVCWWLSKDNAPHWLYVVAAAGFLLDEYREHRARRLK